jgi:outer membrane protein assembly factor BamA
MFSSHRHTLLHITALLLLAVGVRAQETATGTKPDSARSAGSLFEWTPFPVYDSDIGFGAGARLSLRNALGKSERFEVSGLLSTKGERWFRFLFSMPDEGLRQGSAYPLAVDVLVDYDKMIRNSFFGAGNAARFADREYYTREPLECSVTLSRGLTRTVVVSAAARWRVVRNFGFDEGSRLAQLPPALNQGRAANASLLLAARYDTRDHLLAPSRGTVLQAELEHAPSASFNDAPFTRVAASLSRFVTIVPGRLVFAGRIGAQQLVAGTLPVQFLLPLGGNQTLRGEPLDRYLDKATLLCNAELRFPLYRRLGAVAGLDAGKVWSDLRKADMHDWSFDPMLGLRYALETYIVRFDVGFGMDAMRVCFTFNHLF